MRELRGVLYRWKRTAWAENGALWNLKVRVDEGKLCGRIPTVDVQDERYEVSHAIVVKQMKCQTRWKDDGVGWSGQEYQRQLIDEEDKGRRLVA